MSIRDLLLPALKVRFPKRAFRAGTAPDPIATFASSHPDFGDLQIFDDGGEATLVLGRHTHSHFTPYAASSEADLAATVTASVIEFLDDLFADRVLVWSHDNRSGGWYTLPQDSSGVPSGARTFLWSGPVDLAAARSCP